MLMALLPWSDRNGVTARRYSSCHCSFFPFFSTVLLFILRPLGIYPGGRALGCGPGGTLPSGHALRYSGCHLRRTWSATRARPRHSTWWSWCLNLKPQPSQPVKCRVVTMQSEEDTDPLMSETKSNTGTCQNYWLWIGQFHLLHTNVSEAKGVKLHCEQSFNQCACIEVQLYWAAMHTIEVFSHNGYITRAHSWKKRAVHSASVA